MRYVLPLAVFVALAALLGIGLTLNPRLLPSPLVGNNLPSFTLPRLESPGATFSSADLRGEVSLLNVWATWCVGCREEHGLLVQIAAEEAVPIYGLNYKDQYKSALRWLADLGNPYRASGYDADGKVGIDLGVYGLPETFVVDREGRVAYKHVGPVTREIWEQELRPLIESLREPAG